MFKGCHFLIIKSDKLAQAQELHRLLASNHAAHISIKDEYDNLQNFMDPPAITHIITETIEFIEYLPAVSSMVPVVSPQWVYDLINFQHLQPPRGYNPNPRYFLKDVFVCCCDNLPSGDKELIYGAVSAFGGAYVDTITKNTTHLVALDVMNEKAVVAASVARSASQHGDIRIVVPHWIDHCITLGKKLDEKEYLLSDPAILRDKKSGESGMELESGVVSSVLGDSLPKEEYDRATLECFKGKRFYLSSDFNWSQRLSNSIKLLIERHGGKIVSKFDAKKVDIYLGKFRQGENYKASCLNSRIIVGNLQWLYSIVVSRTWTLPLNSNILYYPIPSAPLPEFQGLKISITNYSGDTRQYLGKLITIMGGYFTTTLTRDNDYLVCAKASGKKFDAALNKWLDDNGKTQVKVVNHLWLEDCFTQWARLDDTLDKYKNFGNDMIGMEPLVGRTQLDADVLQAWCKEDGEVADETGDINDSMSEEESTQPKVGQAKSVEVGGDDTSKPPLPSSPVAKPHTPSTSTTQETTPEAPPAISSAVTPKKEESPIPVTQSRYGGRSAAKKAAAKLHDNMSDLIAYQELVKSKRKMKDYMENLEGSTTPKKRKYLEEPEDPEEVSNESSDIEIIEETTATDFTIIAIMTGCESEIELKKSDHVHLNNLGIKIVTELKPNQTPHPNTLIAPKILRTEKFLRSLSQVDRIIHPNYLINILEHVADKGKSVLKEYRIDDYALDKVIKNIDVELGYAKGKTHHGLQKLLESPNRGELFTGVNLNLSSNLNGGVPLIAKVLLDHGMSKYKEIKNALNVSNQVISSVVNGKELRILIANKKKDTRLINTFKDSFGGTQGVVLDWDWCVKSIFKMELEDMKKYAL
ncbi:hypothetical protein Cantr_03722 [Candida viswanathii]|uniref:BRCT domain-containing protein n=1 Tax=Candida viswanathii TaxID=5486 RepID=A0A367XPN6_9ASCO|nr:hypothetical protein Cantr_03722 [Candida viswanathii]